MSNTRTEIRRSMSRDQSYQIHCRVVKIQEELVCGSIRTIVLVVVGYFEVTWRLLYLKFELIVRLFVPGNILYCTVYTVFYPQSNVLSEFYCLLDLLYCLYCILNLLYSIPSYCRSIVLSVFYSRFIVLDLLFSIYCTTYCLLSSRAALPSCNAIRHYYCCSLVCVTEQ